MFRHLLINTIASAGAFLAASLVGFLLVPVLVGAYGMKEFGLILLARVFLPTGVLVLFDFGFSEITTQAVARARETNEWQRTSQVLSILFAMAVGVGVLLGLLLVLGAGRMAHIFDGDAASSVTFAGVLRATGMALPLLFVVGVLEGIVKGFGAFRSLRLIEVTCSLAFAAAAILITAMRLPYEAVAYAFLAMALARGTLIALNAARAGLGRNLKISLTPGRQELAGLLPQCKVMAQNRLLGVLQGPAQQPLVGLLVGPAAVALFDVLTRLPRFFKAAIGLLGSALIPVAARLDAGNDTTRMSKLAGWGLLLSACAAIPPSAGAALMGEPLLRLWVGPTFAAYWHWHALMFVIPVAASLVSFGSTALLVRPQALAKANRIGAIQLTLQYALAIALLGQLQERALLLSQALSVVVASGFIGALLVREHQLETRLLWRVGAIIALGFALAILYGSLRDPRSIEGWTNLASQFTAWCLVYWAAIWVLVLEKSEKQKIRAAFFFLMAPVGEARRTGT